MERLHELIRVICNEYSRTEEFLIYPVCTLKLSTEDIEIDNITYSWFGNINWRFNDRFITIPSHDVRLCPHYYIDVAEYTIHYYIENEDYERIKKYVVDRGDIPRSDSAYLVNKLEDIMSILQELILSTCVTRLTN